MVEPAGLNTFYISYSAICHGCTVHQKLDMSGLFSSKCRHIAREKNESLKEDRKVQ